MGLAHQVPPPSLASSPPARSAARFRQSNAPNAWQFELKKTAASAASENPQLDMNYGLVKMDGGANQMFGTLAKSMTIINHH